MPIVPSGAVELLMFQEPGSEPRLEDAAALQQAVDSLQRQALGARRRLRRAREPWKGALYKA